MSETPASETPTGTGHVVAHSGHGFSTLPVFLAAISTILGAIMFLRFGYAVGHLGVVGAFGVILLGHMVTVPTALAVSELATNRKVEGGGEYYIISRSFGTVIGGAIGISLYLSQAVSVAFYMIAFAEALRPLAPMLESAFGIAYDARMASIPGILILGAVILKKGADLGVKALVVVFALLTISLISFFIGSPVAGHDPGGLDVMARVADADAFFVVFAIVFPAFTGMTAGVGLSGDLANPGRSIPLGTMLATGVGLLVYAAVVIKLAASATPDLLAEDQHVMSQIAPWAPLILVGLACATVSSAIGSILVAPRTLQALANDRCFPIPRMNKMLAEGRGPANEPFRATLLTIALAVVMAALGGIDVVAKVVSMFFMVTYGALCTISFLEHFAANPSYRPSFRSRWYVSLFGAGMCFFLMFQMAPIYAALSLVSMLGLYRLVRRSQGGRDDLAAIFQGVMTQATRYMQLRIQRERHSLSSSHWRPSIVTVGERTFSRRAPRALLGWLCHRHGFGTYMHLIRGYLDKAHIAERSLVRDRLVALSERHHSGLFLDAIVSPSMRTALAQTLQLPGVSGMDNNSVLFEYMADDDPDSLQKLPELVAFADAADKNVLLLRSSENNFGDRSELHVWIGRGDERNANLMVLLGYIILGHPDWHPAQLRVFVAAPDMDVEQQRRRMRELISSGRIPVSEKNLRFIPGVDGDERELLIAELSADADLVVLGLDVDALREQPTEVLARCGGLNDVLMVAAKEQILIE